jgi:mRNA interferase MazF
MVARKKYAPGKGDIVWLDFDPQVGREQKGKRSAVVLSLIVYNEKSGMALMCPITSHEKGYPFEVRIRGKKVSGVALADQIKSVDWRGRAVRFVEKARDSEVAEVVGKVKALMGG